MTTKVTKNLLDTVFVAADGTEPMTGVLVNAAGRIIVKAAVASVNTDLEFGELDGTRVGLIRTDGSSLSITRYASGTGTFQTALNLTTDGNVTVNAAAPQDVDHLTRKDYVDDTTVSLTGDTMTGNLRIDNSAPRLNLNYDAAAADSGLWDILASTGQLRIRAVNDANSVATTAIEINRSGITIDSIALTAPVSAGGSLTTTGDVTIQHAGDNAAIKVRSSTARGVAGSSQFRLEDSAGSRFGRLISNTANAAVQIDIYNADGATVDANFIFQPDGNIAASGTLSAPQSVNDLTRKDYVDTTTVALDGSRVMTGGLLITSGNPQLRVRNAVLDGLCQVRLQDFAGGDRVQQIFDESNDIFQIQQRDAGATLQTSLTWSADGNVYVNGTGPTAVNHLTRKDYVDTYVQSRGENLVTNTTGLFEDNTNFSTFVYDSSESYAGAGCFSVTTTSTTKIIDEILPVDVNRNYEYAVALKEKTPGDGPEQPNFYMLLHSFDSDKLVIAANHIMYQTGTETTLAADLNDSDTTIVLTDSTNWNDSNVAPNYQRSISIYGYANAGGHVYDDYTYTRDNFWDIYAGNGSINFGTHTITLSSPWSGGSFAAGTAVTNANSGGSYVYPVSNQPTPADWTIFSGVIAGLQTNGVGPTNNFRHGTAFIQPGFLLNRDVTNPTTTLVDSLSFGLDIANQTDIDSRVAIDGSSTMTGGLIINAAWPDNVFAHTLQDSVNSNRLRTMLNPTAAAYNGIVELDDMAMIFDEGTSGTGALVLAGWNGTGWGLRLDNVSRTSEFTGKLTATEVELTEFNETANSIATTGAVTLDVTTGSYFYNTATTGIITFTFSNPVATGRVSMITLELFGGGTNAPVWPASVDWPGGTEPTWTTGVDVVTFITRDAGTTWLGMLGGTAFA